MWYNRLNSKEEYGKISKGLFSFTGRQSCGAVLAKGVTYQDNVCFRYRNFNNPVMFLQFIVKNLPNISLHEVIFGERPQKLRFDIDLKADTMEGVNINDVGNNILSLLINRIIYYFFVTFNINLKPMENIFITESHTTNKFSSHVIIDDYFFMSHKHAEVIFNRILDCNELKQYCTNQVIDCSLYAKTRNFRILGSTKYDGEGQKKKLVENIIINGIKYEFNSKSFAKIKKIDQLLVKKQLLISTLVTFIDHCKLLDVEIPQPIYNAITVNNESINDAIELIESIYPGIFTVDSKQGNCIWMKHSQPYYCDVCERKHEKMPIKVFVGSKSVKIYCNRASGYNKGKYINLSSEESKEKNSILNEEPKTEHKVYNNDVINSLLSSIITPRKKSIAPVTNCKTGSFNGLKRDPGINPFI